MWRVVGSYATLLVLDGLKALGVRGPGVKHFSFGANLDPRVMANRKIETRGRRVEVLEGHRLVFDLPAPFEGAAYASVRADPSSRVLGVVVELDAVDALRLHCFEQCWMVRRNVVRFAGDAFYYQTRRPREGLRPTNDYLGKILRGFDAAGLGDREEVRPLRSLDAAVDPPECWAIHFVIDDYEALGRWGRPLLRSYDALNARLYFALWRLYHSG